MVKRKRAATPVKARKRRRRPSPIQRSAVKALKETWVAKLVGGPPERTPDWHTEGPKIPLGRPGWAPMQDIEDRVAFMLREVRQMLRDHHDRNFANTENSQNSILKAADAYALARKHEETIAHIVSLIGPGGSRLTRLKGYR